MSYRNTYALINIDNIKYNVKKIINKYNDYKYYFGVIKADFYGHNRKEIIDALIEGGINYFAVSSLDEAIDVREYTNMPILCLGYINPDYIDICINNNIDIMVDNLDYCKYLKKGINVHIKIDSGMNRLGIKDNKDFLDIYNYLNKNNIYIKGIFTHIYDAFNDERTNDQINTFMNITKGIDLSKIDIIHISQSDTLVNHSKISFCNGCRLGIIMYGLNNNDLELKSTFKLVSEVIEIKKIKKGEVVSYSGNYKALKDETIAIVSIGYADGVNRHLSSSYIYINNKKYKIVGNICMDMLMVLVDDSIKLHDKVYIYYDNDHINYLSSYLNTIPYELLCNVSKRVPRIIKNK